MAEKVKRSLKRKIQRIIGLIRVIFWNFCEFIEDMLR